MVRRDRVAICIATRRRPDGLRRLLDSLSRLDLPEPAPAVRVLVVDNDPSGAQTDRLREFASSVAMNVTVLHEPETGIPQARNAALQEALHDADWIAFVDDDERVDPGWLRSLLATARSTGADGVAGPVLPDFSSNAPRWVLRAGLHDRPRHPTGTELVEARTGNLLVRADLLRSQTRWFDTRLALVGGSDTELTRRLVATGARFVWDNEAIVYETVPRERTTLRWHLRRNLRIGANRIDRARLERSRVRRTMVTTWYVLGSVAELVVGVVVGILGVVLSLGRGGIQIGLRAVRAVGTLGRWLGIEITEYRQVVPLYESRLHSRMVFLMGCGRSGTTLLRAMLDASTTVAIPGETHFIPRVLRRHGMNRPLSDDEVADLTTELLGHPRLSRWVVDRDELRHALSSLDHPSTPELIEELFAAYAQAHGASHHGDKTPEYVREIALLSEAFPDSKFVHVVRDPRDTALSLVEASWGPDDLAAAFRFWRKRVLTARRQARTLSPAHYLEVHYEDLIRDPEATLRRVCSFAGWPFEDRMLRYWENDGAAGTDAMAPEDHHNVRSPLHKTRDWRVALSRRDRLLADHVTGDAMTALGYRPSGERATAVDRVVVATRVMWGYLHDLRRWARDYPTWG